MSASNDFMIGPLALQMVQAPAALAKSVLSKKAAVPVL